MEIVNVDIKLGGDNNNVVNKRGITVAEAKVLYELHGGSKNEPILAVEVVDDLNVDARSLKGQLANRYGRKPEYSKVLEDLFPGVKPEFIEKAADIGLPDGVPIKSKAGPKPKTKKDLEIDPLG